MKLTNMPFKATPLALALALAVANAFAQTTLPAEAPVAPAADATAPEARQGVVRFCRII